MLRRLIAVVGIALLAFLFYRLGPSEILALGRAIGWNFFIVVAIFGGQELVRTAAVLRCLPGEPRPRFREVLGIRFMGEAVRQLTFTGPFLSEPTRAWLLSRRVLRSAEAFAAAFAEFLAFSLVSAGLTAASVLYLLRRFDFSTPLDIAAKVVFCGSVAFLVAAGVAIVRRVPVIGNIVKGLSYLPVLHKRWNPDMDEVRHMETVVLSSFRDQPFVLLQVMSLEVVAHGLLVVETYWVMASMSIAFPPLYPLLVESVTKIVNVALFVGATEGVYALIFDALGLVSAAGFTLSLTKRLRSLTVAALGLAIMSILPGDALSKRRKQPPVRSTVMTNDT
jgi:hypothetical protein